MIIIEQLTGHIDEELKELFSQKDTSQYVLSTAEIMNLSHHKNSTQLISSSLLLSDTDYIHVNFNKHPILIKRLIELGLCKNRHTSKTNLFFESGIWKVLLNSKSRDGLELRNFLANKVLPEMVSLNFDLNILSSVKPIE